MGYRAIKTSESGDKFLSTLFKFRTKPHSTRSSASEGILSGWVSGFGRQADVVWSCPLGFCDMWTLFEIILAGFCDERWHYLTVSWHYPLGHLWISLCLTPSQKHVEFQMETKIQNNFSQMTTSLETKLYLYSKSGVCMCFCICILFLLRA